MRESFLLFKSFYEPTKHLSPYEKGQLYDAIFHYQLDGTEPEADNSIRPYFLFFKNQFRLDAEKYQETVDANRRNAEKRWAKLKDAEHATASDGIRAQSSHANDAKNADNDNENEKENGNENEKDLEPQLSSRTSSSSASGSPRSSSMKSSRVGSSKAATPRPPTDIHQLVEHTHTIQGLAPYLSKPRQYKAAKDILAAYPLDQAKQVAEAMHDDPYWKKATFDVVQLQNNFHKYVAKVAVEEEYDEVVERQSEIAYQMLLELQAKEEAEQHLSQEAHGD